MLHEECRTASFAVNTEKEIYFKVILQVRSFSEAESVWFAGELNSVYRTVWENLKIKCSLCFLEMIP